MHSMVSSRLDLRGTSQVQVKAQAGHAGVGCKHGCGERLHHQLGCATVGLTTVVIWSSSLVRSGV